MIVCQSSMMTVFTPQSLIFLENDTPKMIDLNYLSPDDNTFSSGACDLL